MKRPLARSNHRLLAVLPVSRNDRVWEGFPLESSSETRERPDGTELGVELDEDALERCRIEPLEKLPGLPPHILLAIRWPSGAAGYYATAVQYRGDF